MKTKKTKMNYAAFKKMVERISEEYDFKSKYSTHEIERILAKYEFGSYIHMCPRETAKRLRDIFWNVRNNFEEDLI